MAAGQAISTQSVIANQSGLVTKQSPGNRAVLSSLKSVYSPGCCGPLYHKVDVNLGILHVDNKDGESLNKY